MYKICLILISFSIQAKIINHDSIGARLHDYSFKEFCSTMKSKSDTLISVAGVNEIECFNQKFKISDFCTQKLPLEASYTRGFAVENEKKVYCEEANSISISLTCDSFKDACKSPKSSCEKLKKVYANRLEISNSSKVEDKLNCYFTKKAEEDLYDL